MGVGTVRVLRPTSSTEPSGPSRITTTADVARETPRRFRGNADGTFIELDDRLRRCLGACSGIDVDHHLIAVARRPAIEVSL